MQLDLSYKKQLRAGAKQQSEVAHLVFADDVRRLELDVERHSQLGRKTDHRRQCTRSHENGSSLLAKVPEDAARVEAPKGELNLPT
jgi:hypothetical protein